MRLTVSLFSARTDLLCTLDLAQDIELQRKNVLQKYRAEIQEQHCIRRLAGKICFTHLTSTHMFLGHQPFGSGCKCTSFLVLLLLLKFMEEKSASPFQEGVSLLQERVRLQNQTCDRREEEHTRALDDLRQAESKVQDVKSQASIMEVWRTALLLQVLHRQQAKHKKAHHNLKFLTDKVSESKSFVQQRHQGP